MFISHKFDFIKPEPHSILQKHSGLSSAEIEKVLTDQLGEQRALPLQLRNVEPLVTRLEQSAWSGGGDSLSREGFKENGRRETRDSGKRQFLSFAVKGKT